jgi:hypothetical protein
LRNNPFEATIENTARNSFVSRYSPRAFRQNINLSTSFHSPSRPTPNGRSRSHHTSYPFTSFHETTILAMTKKKHRLRYSFCQRIHLNGSRSIDNVGRRWRQGCLSDDESVRKLSGMVLSQQSRVRRNHTHSTSLRDGGKAMYPVGRPGE